MKIPTAFPLGNSLGHRARRVTPAFVLAFAALFALTSSAMADSSLVNNSRPITGGIEVRLIFTDADGKHQEYLLANLPAQIFSQLPRPLQLESKLPFLQPGFFLADWGGVANGVCADIVPQIKQYINSPDNSAYDVSCKPMKYGIMHAQIQTSWEDNILQGWVYGRRLVVSYYVPPYNSVPFWVTSPSTSHRGQGNMFSPDDPKFTLLYDVTFQWIISGPDRKSIKLPLNVVPSAGIEPQGLLNGAGYDKQIQAAISKWESQMAVDATTAIADWYAALIAAVVQTVKDLLFNSGAIVADAANAHLRDEVSAKITYLSSSSAAQAMNTGTDAFNTFIAAVESADALGFTELDVDIGPKNSLLFKLTYPTPAKPSIWNTAAAVNKGIHLIPPSIGTGGQQVKPGVPFLVNGSNFRLAYTNALNISWDHTVVGIAKSQLQWGPKGGTMHTVPVVLDTYYNATPLKPSTAYQFRVQECDAISCSPWSDWLETSTESAGSDTVKLWLDSNTAQPIGTAPLVGSSSGFVIKATIPAGTAAGNHTINAAAGGNKPEASAQITVAGQGGVGATIAVMNTTTHTAYKPPISLLYPSTFRLRGDGFTPGTTVTVHLDTPTGAQLGTAIPNKAGIFLGNFTLPFSTSTGPHSLVAVQGTIQASEGVNLMAQPK